MSAALGQVVTTQDGSLTLRHPEWDEEYHSHMGARTEAEELYIARSGIKEVPVAARDLSILDVGLGLAYNAFATLHAWASCAQPGSWEMVSLEINPDLVETLSSGDAPWMTNWSQSWREWALALQKTATHQWQATITHPSSVARFQWTIVTGHAKAVDWKAVLQRPVDFIWQDPFSPQKNPVLWDADWFARVRDVSAPDATLMTYSVARVVRDALHEAQWEFQKIPGMGSKKHWLKAQPRDLA